MDRSELEAIKARLIPAHAAEAAEIDPKVDGYYCAECMKEWGYTLSNADEGGEWNNGDDVCDTCASDRRAATEQDVTALLEYVGELEAERDHYRALYRVTIAPWIAGPPSSDLGVEWDESATVEVRVRTKALRVLIWHFATLAKANPAPNYLSMTYGFPAELSAGDLEAVGLEPEMIELAGWHLEIAAVKPGGNGPSQLKDAAEAERDEARANLAWQDAQHGTRAEQEDEDREAAKEWEAIQAMTSEEVAASLQDADVETAGTMERIDTLVKVCVQRAALVKQLASVETQRDRLDQILRCERGEWAPEGWAYNFGQSRWDNAAFTARVWRILWLRREGVSSIAYGWEAEPDRENLGRLSGSAPTALEAIEAANAALSGAANE